MDEACENQKVIGEGFDISNGCLAQCTAHVTASQNECSICVNFQSFSLVLGLSSLQWTLLYHEITSPFSPMSYLAHGKSDRRGEVLGIRGSAAQRSRS